MEISPHANLKPFRHPCCAGYLELTVLWLLAVAAVWVLPLSVATGGDSKPNDRVVFHSYFDWSGDKIMGPLVAKFRSNRNCGMIAHTPLPSGLLPDYIASREIDLGMVLDCRMDKKRQEEATHFEKYVLGRFAVGVAVHAKDRLRSLTIDELERIYYAHRKPWKGPNGEDYAPYKGMGGSPDFERLEAYYPCEESAPSAIFRKRVLGTLYFGDAVHGLDSSPPVHRVVATEPNTIGILICPPEDRPDKRIRFLAIAKDKDSEPIPLTAQTIADGSYPLTDMLTLYLHPDAPPEAREFCKFATGPEAVEIIKQGRVWPEYELQKELGKQRLTEVKAGKGTPITVYSLVGRTSLLQDLAMKFVEAKATVQMKVEKKGDWDEAFKRYAQGEIDFFLTDESATEEEMTPKDTKEENPKVAANDSKAEDAGNKPAKPKHQKVELGQMAVGIVVHPENLLESLPMRELRGILSGEIKKWPGMKDPVAKIHLMGLDLHDPITLLLKEKLAEAASKPDDSSKSHTTSATLAKYTVKPDTEKVILAVASDPSAIGFVDLSQVSPKEKSVKIIPVFVKNDPARKPGKEPKPIEKADSPLVRTLFLHVSPKASQTAKDFAEYLASGDCREILTQHGLIPPSPKMETVQRKPELPDLKEFAKKNQATKDAGNKGNAIAAIPALNLPDPEQDNAKAKAKSSQNTDAPVALPDVPQPGTEPWRTALEGTGTPSNNPSSPPFGAPKRPAEPPSKSSRSSGRESANSSGSPAIALFAIAGAAGLVIAMFAWFGSVQRKRKKR